MEQLEQVANRIDNATVRGIADAMVVDGMRDAGYTYVKSTTLERASKTRRATSIPIRNSQT
jgi:hypothetical protein